jgi:hypothetical protein
MVVMRQPGERISRYLSTENFHSVLHELSERDAHLYLRLCIHFNRHASALLLTLSIIAPRCWYHP